MPVYMDGLSYRWDNAVNNAILTRASLDTSLRRYDDDAESLINHYKYCKKEPTVGMMIEKKYLFNKEDKNRYFYRNLNVFNKMEAVRNEKDNFEKCFNEMYPKSGKARKYLVDSKSIVLDYIKPIHKNLLRRIAKLLLTLNK